jgi:hypothetical protein
MAPGLFHARGSVSNSENLFVVLSKVLCALDQAKAVEDGLLLSMAPRIPYKSRCIIQSDDAVSQRNLP